jgi:hypothetical protein
MAQIADITVYDGASTPVSHTLKAVSVSSEKGVKIVEWREKLASLPDEAQVSCILRQTRLASGVVKQEYTVEFPVMESISGQNSAGYTASPKVAYIDRMVVTNFAHPRSTVTGRRTCRQLAVNLANNVTSSVAAATSGPIPDAFDSLLLPT